MGGNSLPIRLQEQTLSDCGSGIENHHWGVQKDMPVIKCRNVYKRFYEKAESTDSLRDLKKVGLFKYKREIVAVDNVSFTVQKGEILGVLGANGSGKSTLIRLISTLLFPDDGVIEVFGLNVVHHQLHIRRRINRVSVEASFFKKLSAVENLIFAGRLYGMTANETKEKASFILQRLGFSNFKMKSPVESMSRGQQQKISIARAFMTEPELLLLDEPTTGLDPKSRRDVQDFVENIKAKQEMTMILTTHDMAEAERLCDRIVILDGGRVAALGTPEELRTQAGPEVKTFEDVFFTFAGRDWVILLISGVYYPVTVLPSFVQFFSWLSPATYSLAMARDALLADANLGTLWVPLIKLGTIGIVLIPVGLIVFSVAERYAMRTGRLKRNG